MRLASFNRIICNKNIQPEKFEGMLPHADDCPSPAPKLAGDAAVAGYVVLAFAVAEMPTAIDQILPAARSRVKNSEGSMIGMP